MFSCMVLRSRGIAQSGRAGVSCLSSSTMVFNRARWTARRPSSSVVSMSRLCSSACLGVYRCRSPFAAAMAVALAAMAALALAAITVLAWPVAMEVAVRAGPIVLALAAMVAMA